MRSPAQAGASPVLRTLLLPLLLLPVAATVHLWPNMSTFMPQYKMRIDSLKTCINNSETTTVVNYMTMRQTDRNKYSVDAEVEWLKPVDTTYSLSITVYHCKDRTKPDSCSHYWEDKIPHYCSEVGKTYKIWSGFFKRMEGFNATCPLQPGKYRIKDAPMDLVLFKAKLVVPDGYWLFKARSSQKGRKELVLCTDFGLDVRTFRNTGVRKAVREIAALQATPKQSY